MQKFIMSERGIIANPIETSSILTSPEAKALKASGQLVGDRTVVQLMFEQLLNPKYRSGCIVDGFPRTPTQAECMKLLYDKMRAMHDEYHSTELRDKFPRPIFHVMVLFIEEDISVERQLLRGRQVISHNRQVELTGVGSLEPVRATDSDPVLARQRYQQFKEQFVV
jgi:adenylate kinase